MRPILSATAATLLFAAPTTAQEPDHLEVVDQIKREAFENSRVMDYAGYLTDVVGPRLTGSSNMRQAQGWAAATMREMGLSGVELEPFGEEQASWDLERVSVHMIEPDYQMVIAYPLAFSPGTGGPIVERAVLAVVETPADLDALRGRLQDAIVLATPPQPTSPRFVQDAFRHTEESLGVFETEGTDLFNARYGNGQPDQRSFRPEGITEVKVEQFFKSEGVAAILKASQGSDGTVRVSRRPGSRNDPSRAGIESALPTLAVAAEHYNRIYRLLERGLSVTMEVDVRVAVGDAETEYNVIAEIPGTDLADEVVAIGAHLDSWHSGTGATDNAAGSAVVMEVMRILKAIDARPRRTIRVMLWSHEEGGLKGSRGYVRRHFGNPADGTATEEHEKFSVYFNMDNGTGQVRGVHLQGHPLVAPIFEAWMEPFNDLGVKTLSRFSNTGTDHLAFDEAGLPGFQFVQDRIDYRSRTHHFNMDTFDRLLPHDLMINASVMASFTYHAAMRDEKIPRKP
jgi:carboxypeptidase Q